MTHDARRGQAKIAGVRWAYTDVGAGPLICFFHGTLASKEMFDDQVAVLSANHRCVAVDWPGHGESGHDPDGWTVADLVEGVPALVEHLGARRATLVGLSQGGAISLRVAIERPDIVARLVTLGAGPDGPPAEATTAMAELGRALSVADEPGRRSILAARQGRFHSPEWMESHPDAAERELTLMLGHDPSALPLLTLIPAGYGTVEDRLSDIACPTLVLWGAHDPRNFWAPRMGELIPGSEVAVLPDAGHHIPLDSPAETSRLLVDFFARHPVEEEIA